MADQTTPAIDHARITALTNCHYHQGRESFLDGTHRWLIFFIIVAGASAFSDVVYNEWKPFLSLSTAVMGAFDLVFDLQNRARTHAQLKAAYFEIASGLEDNTLEASAADARMMKLAAGEPPLFCASYQLSHNHATEIVLGDKAPKPYSVGPIKRWFKNYWRFDSDH